MATLITPIPSLMFPWELDTLRISAAEDTAVRLELGNSDIFAATLTPTSAGYITIDTLRETIQDALSAPCSEATTLYIYLDETLAAATSVVYCRTIGSVPALTFAAKSFLTMASGATKLVREDSTEVLSWIASGSSEAGEESVSVEAIWFDSSTAAVKTSEQTIQCTGEGSIDSADVSPSKLSAPDTTGTWCLSSYTVTLGRRSASYAIPNNGRTNADTLAVTFYNAFGQRDTFLFLGQTEEELKPTYSGATFGGNYRNYRIEAQPSFTAATGALTEGMRRLFADLLTAQDVWRTADGVQLSLTDSSFKPTTSWGESASGTATFRENLSGQRLEPVLSANTFDSTYDQTYE